VSRPDTPEPRKISRIEVWGTVWFVEENKQAILQTDLFMKRKFLRQKLCY